MVVVNSGTVTPGLSPDMVPQDKWDMLMREWRDFIKREFAHDCRELGRYIKQADESGMWKSCGFDSLEDFISRGLELEPEVVNWAMEGLDIYGIDEPVGMSKAATRGERNENIRAMRNEGMTQQAIADEVGSTRETVRDVLAGKQSKTEKPPNRNSNARTLYIPQSPETAAQKIRDKFGDEFADKLKSVL